MTRRERIEFLLANYVDVEHGLQDRGFRGDDFIPRMCRAYSHPSYVELRRLIPILRDSEPFCYWHLAETYFRFTEVRVAECPSCRRQFDPSKAWDEDKGGGGFCKHGGRSVKLVPRIKRKVSYAVRPEQVSRAVDWLDEHFMGDPFVPDDLLPLAA